MKEFNKKKKLLEMICEHYNYELMFTEKSVICDGGDDDYYLTYKNIDEALIDWVETLIDTDEEFAIGDIEPIWTKEIKYIREIEGTIERAGVRNEEKVTNELNEKKKLLEEICKFYWYDLEFTQDSIVCIGDEETFNYKTIDEALVDWLQTLVETDEDSLLNDNGAIWKEEIDYIKEIKRNMAVA